ncbi:hypothetical protein MCAV_03680 [[Mycoplasma] cavipharyngis]|uniref:hypothetical protein n=1 Tax=[Mycoplasma] cavipharyngis TaxID=92757 RepID=UPI003703DDFA
MNYIIITIFFFFGLTIFGFVTGFFSNWKKVLYYGILNLLLFGFFIIFFNQISNQLNHFFNTNSTIQSYLNKVAKPYVQYQKPILFFLKDYLVVITYIIAAVILNILLTIIYCLFLRRLFLLTNKTKQKKRKIIHRLGTALLQSMMLLPISFTLTGTMTSMFQITTAFTSDSSLTNFDPEKLKTRFLSWLDSNDGKRALAKFNQGNLVKKITHNSLKDNINSALKAINSIWSVEFFNRVNLFSNLKRSNERIIGLIVLYQHLDTAKSLFTGIFQNVRDLFDVKSYKPVNDLIDTIKQIKKSNQTTINFSDAQKLEDYLGSSEDLINKLKNGLIKLNELSPELIKKLTPELIKQLNPEDQKKVNDFLKNPNDSSSIKDLTSEQFFNNLKEVIDKFKDQAITNDTIRMELLKNNPKLNTSIANLNQIYANKDNRIVIKSLETIFNDISENDLKNFDEILNSLNFSQRIESVKKTIAGFTIETIKYASDQIGILANGTAPNGTKLASNNKLQSSPQLFDYLKLYLSRQIEIVFKDKNLRPSEIADLAKNFNSVFMNRLN